MKKNSLFFISTLAIGMIVGLFVASRLNFLPLVQSQEVKSVKAVSMDSGKSEDIPMEDAVINVAKTTGRAVVSISTEHTAKIGGKKRMYFNNQPFNNSPFGDDEIFNRFFKDFMGDMPDTEFKQEGLGSGVIIDAEGYILTNEHVIDGADKMTVTLPDGREFKAELKGKDERSDLAVIKIDAHNLPIASLGDSDNTKIGQWVVAIGNPFGFSTQNPEPTVTTGVISALHRSLGRVLSRDRDYNDLVQTDAAINPGNSGGPLVNLKGEVIGINVAIFSTTGGYQGIGFAIPINNAKRVISRLIEGKKITYSWLGVTVQDINDDLASYFGLPNKNGILVAKVLEDGPASKGGMKEKDIIKQLDNKAVSNVKELLAAVSKAEIGKKIKVLVLRDKKDVVLEVLIGERPDNLDNEGAVVDSLKASSWRGLQVENITPENAQRFKAGDNKGVVIVNIESASLAESSGLIEGDIIVQMNNQEIKSVADYEAAIKLAKGNILVKTLRGFFLVKGE